MKKVLLIVLLALNGYKGTAQFTESRFREFLDRYSSDPAATVRNEATSDFVYSAASGNVHTLTGLISVLERSQEKGQKRELSDLKVYDFGNGAVASGFFVSRRADGSGQNKTFFTYVFVLQDGSWKLSRAQHTLYAPPFAEDRSAIIATIEAETAAWHAADRPSLAKYSSNTPYMSRVYTNNYFYGDVFKAALEEYWKTHKATDTKVSRSDWNFSRNGNAAYVTFRQTSQTGDNITKTLETRYLERIDQVWKITGVSIVPDKNP